MSTAALATEVLARSGDIPFTKVGWIGYIIIGAIAGWIAGKIVNTGYKQGLVIDVIVGILGALLGGYLFQAILHTNDTKWFLTLLTAIVGAVILLWIVRLVRGLLK